MLEFLKEQESPKALNQTVSTPDPLGNGKNHGDSYITTTKNDQTHRKTTYILLVCFFIGVAGLMLMIRKSVPQTASAAENATPDEKRVEIAVAQLVGTSTEIFNSIDSVVRKFYEFSNFQQVKVGELIKNPFIHQTSWMSEKEISAGQELSEYELALQQASELQLVSIMQSQGRNCCMIEDKILYEGDRIRNFTIDEIGKNFVKLKSGDSKIELKFSQ